MKKRKHHRHTKRLEALFTSGNVSHKGITSDLSEEGLFIRTMYALAPGSTLDIEIHLSEGKVSMLKGIVRRSVKTGMSMIKNGMGVEIIEKDSNYMNLVHGINEERSKGYTVSENKSQETDFSIVACANCGAKNKVKKGVSQLIPKCGKCGHQLTREGKTSQQPEYLIIACSDCKAKNKVASARLSLGPKCGKCGTALRAEDIV